MDFILGFDDYACSKTIKFKRSVINNLREDENTNNYF